MIKLIKFFIVLVGVAVSAFLLKHLYTRIDHKINYYPLFVRVGSFDGLDTETKVKYKGLTIGGASKLIITEDRKCILQIRVKNEYLLPQNSIVKIENTGLFSEKMIMISDCDTIDTKMLSPNDTISLYVPDRFGLLEKASYFGDLISRLVQFKQQAKLKGTIDSLLQRLDELQKIIDLNKKE